MNNWFPVIWFLAAPAGAGVLIGMIIAVTQEKVSIDPKEERKLWRLQLTLRDRKTQRLGEAEIELVWVGAAVGIVIIFLLLSLHPIFGLEWREPEGLEPDCGRPPSRSNVGEVITGEISGVPFEKSVFWRLV